jgi:thiamine pyrophosphate-dependent acetolactate synthase large subunit-like protein
VVCRTAVQYNLPIKVIVIKNNILGIIRWEQMAFLGNPEFAVEFSPIDYAKFAEACRGSQPYARRIGLTLFRNQVHETLKGCIHIQIKNIQANRIIIITNTKDHNEKKSIENKEKRANQYELVTSLEIKKIFIV